MRPKGETDGVINLTYETFETKHPSSRQSQHKVNENTYPIQTKIFPIHPQTIHRPNYFPAYTTFNTINLTGKKKKKKKAYNTVFPTHYSPRPSNTTHYQSQTNNSSNNKNNHPIPASSKPSASINITIGVTTRMQSFLSLSKYLFR